MNGRVRIVDAEGEHWRRNNGCAFEGNNFNDNGFPFWEWQEQEKSKSKRCIQQFYRDLLDHIIHYGIMSLSRQEIFMIGLLFMLQELDVHT